MCNEILNTTEYHQWIKYIKDTRDNVCRCEFKKILERKEKYEKVKKVEEHNRKLVEIDKDVFFLHILEKKSFFKNLKEKFKKYCGEVKFDFEVLNFKRNFKKVKSLFTRKF